MTSTSPPCGLKADAGGVAVVLPGLQRAGNGVHGLWRRAEARKHWQVSLGHLDQGPRAATAAVSLDHHLDQL